MKYSNGNTYIGEFKDGEYHGKGCFQWNDGSYYEGEFS